MTQISADIVMVFTHLLNLSNLRIVLKDSLSVRTDGVGHYGHQIDNHPIRRLFPEVSCPALLKLSPTENSEEP